MSDEIRSEREGEIREREEEKKRGLLPLLGGLDQILLVQHERFMLLPWFFKILKKDFRSKAERGLQGASILVASMLRSNISILISAKVKYLHGSDVNLGYPQDPIKYGDSISYSSFFFLFLIFRCQIFGNMFVSRSSAWFLDPIWYVI